MGKTERRRAPRMAVNGLAYVNLDPDNGGVILNISEGGLCFQSTAPIHRTESIRFWFSYRNHRADPGGTEAWKDEPPARGVSRFIQAGSELAWTNETKKIGGLRFTHLPPGAREQIREWMHQPTVVNLNGKVVPLFPTVKPAHSTTLEEMSAKLHTLLDRVQTARLRTGFSGGLATGVIVSALVVASVVLLSHSRQLGDSLVQLGERLGGRVQQNSPEPQLGAAAAASTLPATNPPSPEPSPPTADSQPVAPAAIPSPHSTNSPLSAFLAVSKPRAIEPDASSTSARSATALKRFTPPSQNFSASRPAVPESVVAPPPDPNANALQPVAPEIALIQPPARIAPSNLNPSVMRSEKFLEVGKFKEKRLADKTTEQLAQKGFFAAVVQKNRFLVKSYQVLVGPYDTDIQAEAVHKDLASLGFTPRSYERGKRDFSLPAGLKVGSTRLPVGYCIVSWESYVPDAIVKMEDERGVGVTVDGKWIKQGVKYEKNAVAYLKNRDGSRTLLEIRFAGMTQALVFDQHPN